MIVSRVVFPNILKAGRAMGLLLIIELLLIDIVVTMGRASDVNIYGWIYICIGR